MAHTERHIELVIRAPARSEALELFDLVRQFPTPTMPEVDAYLEAFADKMNDPLALMRVCVHDGRLVGYVAGDAHSTFYAAGRAAWVDEIFVLPEYRGRGIGRLLMNALEEWAMSIGCRLVGLATAGAAEFYGRQGYTSRAGYFKRYLVD